MVLDLYERNSDTIPKSNAFLSWVTVLRDLTSHSPAFSDRPQWRVSGSSKWILICLTRRFGYKYLEYLEEFEALNFCKRTFIMRGGRIRETLVILPKAPSNQVCKFSCSKQGCHPVPFNFLSKVLNCSQWFWFNRDIFLYRFCCMLIKKVPLVVLNSFRTKVSLFVQFLWNLGLYISFSDLLSNFISRYTFL